MAEEPETYDLVDPDDNPEPSPTAKPPKPISSASAEPETFDLDDEPEIHDPRAGNTPSRPPKPPINPTPDAEDDQPDEPVAVSPARAQANREEQRIRAAQELAAADARKKKMILTVVGSFVAVGILAYIVVTVLT
ncbi:MAG: hypothetical protein AAF593_06145 [Planctomycetota bacterium]